MSCVFSFIVTLPRNSRCCLMSLCSLTFQHYEYIYIYIYVFPIATSPSYKFTERAQVPKAKKIMSIFEKLQVVRYAKEMERNKSIVCRRFRRKSAAPKKRTLKGLNIQAACQKRFPEMTGRVSKWMKQADEERWEELSEQQQKTTRQLTDAQKIALGLNTKRIKGWKALGSELAQEKLQDLGQLSRWSVPGPVLEDREGE